MSKIRTTVGARIRSLRRARGFSQEDLAEKANLNHNYVGDIERGERNVSLDNLYKISRGLGVPLEELFVDSGGKDGRVLEISALMKTTDAETAAFILDLVRRVHRWRKA